MNEIDKKEGFEGKWYLHSPMRYVLMAGLLTGIAFGLAHLQIIPLMAESIFYGIAILLGGYHWIWEGIEKVIKEKEIGIEILMMAATIGSVILGMWDEAALLVFLYGAAEGIEEYTYARTRHSIRNLLDLAPKQALLLQNGEEILIPAEQLKVGDLFLVKPGETIATDGIIVKGASSINEAPVTGESMPIEKKEGMKVFAATSNQEGALQIRVTATFEDNTLSKIIHLVEEAQEQKGKAQLFIEKFGKRYSPLVLLSSLLLLVIPYFLGWNFSEWAVRAVVLLVAAAPCALIMSTPVAIAAGIGKAGKSGILIKGGAHLESLGKLKVVAFDKTGTLTQGTPVVTDVLPLKGDEKELLTLALSLERFSQHPLAQAIVSKAQSMKLEAREASDFESLTGSGVRAKIGNQFLYVGKPEFFSDRSYNFQNMIDIERLRDQGKTVILVGDESDIYGLIGIRDEIRSHAKEVIVELHRMGIKTAMLTGDNERTAQVIATELGLDDVRAGLKPEDKTAAISELERQYGPVAMIGDGVNDAPALARASVGIAMGTAGTDAAIEAADVALMADDLRKAVEAIQLGKRARRIGLQNIIFSLAILVILIPAALAGVMGITIAVFTHEFSEILAVLNGLRMRNVK
ncbi:MAG: ATPase [Deltaproteobacteria bacterium GWA2_45_12]|nr:MAG: ATPase [Deltaproteobacteria bacterium GWA2_45_12]